LKFYSDRIRNLEVMGAYHTPLDGGIVVGCRGFEKLKEVAKLWNAPILPALRELTWDPHTPVLEYLDLFSNDHLKRLDSNERLDVLHLLSSSQQICEAPNLKNIGYLLALFPALSILEALTGGGSMSTSLITKTSGADAKPLQTAHWYLTSP
jgi:hypothetical protein